MNSAETADAGMKQRCCRDTSDHLPTSAMFNNITYLLLLFSGSVL